MRLVLEADFPSDNLTDLPRIRVCKSEEEYSNYGGPGGSTGYWHSTSREIVTYDDASAERENTWRNVSYLLALSHLYYAAQRNSSHPWFDKGLAGVYSGYRLVDGNMVPGLAEDRFRAFRAAREAGKLEPLEGFLLMSEGEFYSKGTVCVPQACALADFLMNGEGVTQTWRPEWSGVLRRYLAKLAETGDREQAHAAAFGSIDLGTVETAYRDFRD